MKKGQLTIGPEMREALRDLKDKEYQFSLQRKGEVVVNGFMVSGTVMTYLHGMSPILPELLKSHPSYLIFMQILWTWITIAILSHTFLTRKRNSSIWNRKLPQPVAPQISPTSQPDSDETAKHMYKEEHYAAAPFGNPENWHLCAVCKVFVPPRTWHCDICETCILRRDHHCLFTGCCIGEENHSNFLGIIFYVSFGTTLFTIFFMYYHLYILDQEIWSYLLRCVPIYNLLNDFDVKYFWAGTCLVGQLMAWGMLLVFIHNALKGQTAADVHRKVYWTVPGCGLVSFGNMRDFLGPQPILRILWPFHPSLKISNDIVRVGGEAKDEDAKRLAKICAFSKVVSEMTKGLMYVMGNQLTDE